MRPLDFWNLAQRLIDTESNPAGYRSATSRAYYGAFLSAVAFLEDFGIAFDKSDPGVHGKVRSIFNNIGDEKLIELGIELGDLRIQRNFADYRLEEARAETRESAELRLREAMGIIGKLNTCQLDRARHEAAKQAARHYASKTLRMKVK
jgi:uncharacterized protein (UPF0332 family)